MEKKDRPQQDHAISAVVFVFPVGFCGWCGMRIETLKLNKEFRRLYYKGTFKGHPLLVTYYLKNGRGTTRIGITAGKKVGNAVARSRARRVIRAAWLEVAPFVPPGCDFVFVARGATPDVKSTRVAQVMKGQVLSLLEGGQTAGRGKK